VPLRGPAGVLSGGTTGGTAMARTRVTEDQFRVEENEVIRPMLAGLRIPAARNRTFTHRAGWGASSPAAKIIGAKTLNRSRSSSWRRARGLQRHDGG